ncbi:hypothetical protein KOAAANKH_00775 [Brevundimonas sp. NIBR10]|uniref:amidohydrolase family protein n=1 Tax=Brevundimonas sp. NIBR10 TaxID=3015997 RepID=UPI0022F153AC|nr:amidohydrolase family protein [Brevundimonas sp. NIBR10]WGM45910.1 hypothetical protein KOAAANKH_00775 [Brevundimonas sp. NIBR10]
MTWRSTTAQPGWIDVHHHLIPPAFTAAMARHGIPEVAGAPLPAWSARESLSTMDAFGIGTALLSLSAPGVHFGDDREACDLARACNEFAAETRETHPGRFGFFATLPMPLTEAACREAIHALDVLKADGVVLLASTNGIFLGDARFEELMAELDRRRTVVFVHPNVHPTSLDLGLDLPAFFVEFLCDTTRAATNMIFKGVIERYPNIRFILSHAGGFLPYVAWRLSLANAMPSLARHAPHGVLHAIRSFYFDTALSPSPWAMGALKALVDPSHILFGSDFPFAPRVAVGLETRSLQELSVFTEAERVGVVRDHALSLFPYLGHKRRGLDRVKPSLAGRVARPVIGLAGMLSRR